MPIYDLIEYSSNYSDKTSVSWLYSKNEATNFNNNIANTNPLKFLKYKTMLFKTTLFDNNNRILRNSTIAVPLKYLSNFWWSL